VPDFAPIEWPRPWLSHFAGVGEDEREWINDFREEETPRGKTHAKSVLITCFQNIIAWRMVNRFHSKTITQYKTLYPNNVSLFFYIWALVSLIFLFLHKVAYTLTEFSYSMYLCWDGLEGRTKTKGLSDWSIEFVICQGKQAYKGVKRVSFLCGTTGVNEP
jgi:hypothetical protein